MDHQAYLYVYISLYILTFTIHSSNLSGIERGFPKIQIQQNVGNLCQPAATAAIRSPLIYTDMFKLIVGFNFYPWRYKSDGCEAIKNRQFLT